MFTAVDGSLFIMPVCYHPTTVLSIDDDIGFLKLLTAELSDKLALLCFDSPEKAIEYAKDKHHYLPFTARCLSESNGSVKLDVMSFRNEIYNPDRFKQITNIVTDYDMPHITGIELIKTMSFPPEIKQFVHIVLTGKISDEFKTKIAELGLNNQYIGKDDPDYVNKLLSLIRKKWANIFQWYSYVPARILSMNKKEKSSFFFDGNFMSIFNAYIKEKNICELYLFDKQGSYIFLDDKANISWLFLRSDQGIKNTIELAIHYGAPKAIIDALKTKKVILSLYEKEDFEKRGNIDWNKYLLPASEFESNDEYLGFFPNLMPTEKGEKIIPKYYYTFTDNFLDNGIEKDKILSYENFLKRAI